MRRVGLVGIEVGVRDGLREPACERCGGRERDRACGGGEGVDGRAGAAFSKSRSVQVPEPGRVIGRSSDSWAEWLLGSVGRDRLVRVRDDGRVLAVVGFFERCGEFDPPGEVVSVTVGIADRAAYRLAPERE
jgi:hypothetical protein